MVWRITEIPSKTPLRNKAKSETQKWWSKTIMQIPNAK
jgi:hypothetical protein